MDDRNKIDYCIFWFFVIVLNVGTLMEIFSPKLRWFVKIFVRKVLQWI